MSEILAQMGGAFRDPGMPEPLPPGTRLPPGMVVPGNINLQGRPLHLNPRSSPEGPGVSSEYSTSFGIEDGRREVLVPTVVNGRFLTTTGEMPPPGSQEYRDMLTRAQKHFEDTGEHMGIFVDPDSANAYAMQAHLRPMNLTPPVYMYHPFDNPGFAKYIQSIRNRLGMGGR